MPRKKAPFKDYEGSKPNDKHIRLTQDMLMSRQFIGLSGNAKSLYLYMKLWACGKIEFEYTITNAENVMPKSTFFRAKKELIDFGFIEIVKNGKFNKTKNIYKFTTKWRTL